MSKKANNYFNGTISIYLTHKNSRRQHYYVNYGSQKKQTIKGIFFYHLRLHDSRQMSLVLPSLQNKMQVKTKQILKSSVSTKVKKTRAKQQKPKKNTIYEQEDEFFFKGNLSDKQQADIQGKQIQQTHKKEIIQKGEAQNQKQKKSRNSFPMNSRSKKSIPDGIIMFVINKLDIFYAKDKALIESRLYEALKEKVLNTKNRYIMLCIVIKKIKSLNYLGTILEKRFSDIEKKKSLKLARISQDTAHRGNNLNFDYYIKEVELLRCIWEQISTDLNEESQIYLSYIQQSAKTIFSHKGRQKTQKTRTSNGIQAIQNSKISQISSLIFELKKFDVVVRDDRTDHPRQEKNQMIVGTNNATRQLPIDVPGALDNQFTAHLDEEQSEDDQN